MAEAPEIPEAHNPFERKVALTIAILAVVLAVISMLGENANLEGILSTSQASNAWAYYQSKSIKEHSYSLQRELLGAMAPGSLDEAKRQALLDRYAAEAMRYEREKDEIKAKAEALEATIVAANRVNDRCDLAALQLQVAIVIGSIAILVASRPFWKIAVTLGVTGAATAITAFL